MSTVNFMLQGKGGCGKSHCSNALSQFIRDHLGLDLVAYDIDQVNSTLTHFKDIGAEHISIVDDNNKFNERQFDNLITNIIDKKGSNIVVDTGSNTFLQFLEYASENDTFGLLLSLGFKVYLHVILAGGDQFNETLNGTKSVLEQINVSTIIWINEFFGPAVERLKETELAQKSYAYKSRIKGYVVLPYRSEKTFGEDIRILSMNKLTLNQALESPLFGIVPRMRLKTIFNDIYAQLDSLDLYSDENE